MALPRNDFWYDGQQRRFLEQLVAAFSGFYYQPGFVNGVQRPPQLVPCRMYTQNKMVAYLQRNMSENTLLSTPMITIAQTGLTGRRNGLQNPWLTENIQVNEREVVDGKYTGNPGNAYTVTRLMPRPFKMTFQVDIWTSNMMQKHQLSEQILTQIFPFFDIQNSDNPLDWTAKTMVEMDESITWSSRNIQIGTGDDIDVMTFTGSLDIWLSPPAKITSQTLIREIITNIYDGGYIDECGPMPGALLRRVIVTPDDAHIMVDGDVITLLNGVAGLEDDNGNLLNFVDYLGQFGTYESGVTTIGITTTFGGPYVAGTVFTDPNNVNQLFWQIDPSTLPSNTLTQPINAVIDPLRSVCAPNDSATLPAPTVGVRYLITASLKPSAQWPGLTANVNDIIQFGLNGWFVAFSAHLNTQTKQYVLNLDTQKQLFWNGHEWTYAIEGVYAPGYWNAQVSNTDVSSFAGNIEEPNNLRDDTDYGNNVDGNVDESGDAEDSEDGI